MKYLSEDFLIIFYVELQLLRQVDHVILTNFGEGVHNYLAVGLGTCNKPL